MNTTELIKTKVAEAKLSNNSCKARPGGCPMQRKCIPELQALTKYEFHAAFKLGLFGNNGHKGTIIENGHSFWRLDLPKGQTGAYSAN